ncbi:MAG TPA: hypothetical protein VMF30_16465 [Pirellulales bacterium]|nr:hypothetical protein [Pirellulales bacterium]
MFALTLLPTDSLPTDVVPSAFQTVLVPLCEGAIVGLAVGSVILLALNAVERVLADTGTVAARAKTPLVRTAIPPALPPLTTRPPAPRPDRPANLRPSLSTRMS